MQITWFGHSAFRLDFGKHAVLLDSFFTGNPAFVSDRDTAIRDCFTMSARTAALAVRRFFKLEAIVPEKGRAFAV